MAASRPLWLGLLLVAGMGVPASGQDCAAIEARERSLYEGVATAADQVGALREAGSAALGATKTCPSSGDLWYRGAHAAELIDDYHAGVAFPAFGNALQIARQAVDHAPQSAALATVLARLDGSIESARHAMALDAGYAPARRTMALASARNGRPEEALRLIAGTDDAGRLARARVLLLGRRYRDAETLARDVLKAPRPDPSELSLSSLVRRDANEILGLALLGDNRQRDAYRPLQAAASAGSKLAQEHLMGMGR